MQFKDQCLASLQNKQVSVHAGLAIAYNTISFMYSVYDNTDFKNHDVFFENQENPQVDAEPKFNFLVFHPNLLDDSCLSFFPQVSHSFRGTKKLKMHFH